MIELHAIRRCATAVLAALVPLALPAAQARPVGELLHAAAGRDALDEALLAQRLAAVRPVAIDDLLQVAATGIVPAEWSTAGEEPLVIDAPMRRAVLRSFRHHELGVVREHLSPLVDEPYDEALRAAALEALGAVGSGHDLALLVALAAPADRTVHVPLDIDAALTAALDAIFARYETAVAAIPEVYTSAHPGTLAPLVRSAAHVGDARALAVLAHVLGLEPAMDVLILSEISNVGVIQARPIDAFVRERVRAQLRSKDPVVAQVAATAAGALEDEDALPGLLKSLEHPAPNVVWAADLALQAIAGRVYHGDVVAWRRWYEEERRWWREEAPGLLADLHSTEPRVVAFALNAISLRRTRRHQLANSVVDVLHRQEPDLVVLACGTLARLRSADAVPALEDCVRDPEPEIAEAARTALAKLRVVVEARSRTAP